MRIVSTVVLAWSCSSTPHSTTSNPQPAPGDAAVATADAAQLASDAAIAVAPTSGITTVADPAQVKSIATVPRQQFDTFHTEGTVALTSEPPSQMRIRWTLVVTDAKAKAHTFVVELPENVAMPVADGAAVVVDAGWQGGGPNAMAHILICDDKGVAIAIDHLPAGWIADYGKEVSVDKSSSYDEHVHAVMVTAPKGKPVELVAKWRAVELAKHRYYGTGNAAKRNLHGKLAPPDYVGAWIDYVLVRV